MNKFAGLLTRLIDSFYFPPFRKIIPLQTFRYAVCGAINLVTGWILYFIAFHFVFNKTDLDLKIVVISPHIAALCSVFPFTLILGYYFNKYVAFKKSPLKSHTQFMRYIVSVAGSLLLNYLLLKIFVDTWGFYPTPSQVVATIIVTLYSYLMQKYFTFRGCVDI